MEVAINDTNKEIGDLTRKTGNLKKIFLSGLIVLTVLCVTYVFYTWTSQKNNVNDDIIRSTETSALLLNGDAFKNLKGLPEDVGTGAYESVKYRLINMVKANKNIRFSYLYTQRDKKLYFMVDSEPTGSKDLSPAGQLYSEVSKVYSKPFADGRSVITDPVTDRWGRWISVLVPIKDPETGKTVAVFGVDYPAESFYNEAKSQTVTTSIISLFAILILAVFYRMLNEFNRILQNAQ